MIGLKKVIIQPSPHLLSNLLRLARFASAMLPVIAANVSESPLILSALRIAFPPTFIQKLRLLVES